MYVDEMNYMYDTHLSFLSFISTLFLVNIMSFILFILYQYAIFNEYHVF